jgi:tetratricopeptide (TPR) repeat protein
MTRTSYVWQAAFDGNAVTGSDASDQPQDLPRRTEGNAAHSLLTTASDYARFVIAVMQGEGLKPETVDAIVSHQNAARRPPRPTPADPYIFWGLGWGIQEGRAGRAFWHWGDNGAWRSYVVAFPERETGVVYFTNSYNGLSVARAIAASVVDDEHWAVDWLGYEQYDDPGRLIRRTIAAAFVEGIDAGVREARGRYALDPDVFDLRMMRNVGQYLSGRGANDAAVAALELNVTFFPDSAASHEQLGEVLHQAGRYAAAIESYKESLAIDPYNPSVAKRVDWIGSRLAVERDPVTVSREQLERYAGVYGPRHVKLGDRGLVYQREGNREYDLISLGEDLFALDGLETFRMLFVGEAQGKAERIVGLYFDGSADESVRSP